MTDQALSCGCVIDEYQTLMTCGEHTPMTDQTGSPRPDADVWAIAGITELQRMRLAQHEYRIIRVESEAQSLSGERAGIATDELGFRDLLDVADAILRKYPPETIVCSHSVKADKGALTTAAIADLIASCRASLPTEGGEPQP